MRYGSNGALGKWILTSAILILTIPSCPLTVYAQSPSSAQIQANLPAGLQDLRRFNSTRSLDDLNATIVALTAAVDVTPTNAQTYLARRRALVAAWAQVFTAIDRAYDPRYDPNNPKDLPQECLTPPRESSGRQAPSCADPNTIQDPKARAKYLDALRANALITAHSNYQTRLRYLDDGAMGALQVSLNLFRRAGAPKDASALDNLLERAGVSEVRRKAIDRMF